MVCSARKVVIVLILTAGLLGTSASALAMSRSLLSVMWSSGTRLAGLTYARAMQARERICMALALYHEARGEPLVGQVAVALAILNRVASSLYPSTICGVVFQHAAMSGTAHRICQFSFACGRRSLLPRHPAVFLRMMDLGTRIMNLVGNGTEALPGRQDGHLRKIMKRFAHVTHFHRRNVRPRWARHMKRITMIGRHVFFSSGRVTKCMPPAIRLRRLYLETGRTDGFATVRL